MALLEAHQDVVEHRHACEGEALLEQTAHTYAGDLIRRKVGDVVPQEGDRAAGSREEAADEVEDRGLAGAIGADEAQDLPGVDLEVEALDCREATEVLGESLRLEQGVHRTTSLAPGSASPETGPTAGRTGAAAAADLRRKGSRSRVPSTPRGRNITMRITITDVMMSSQLPVTRSTSGRRTMTRAPTTEPDTK